MALDIKASLATFKMFTDFAQQRVDEGKGKSIARANNAEAGGLAGRTITAAKGDWVGNVGRLHQPRRQRGPGHRRRAGRADGEEVVRPLTAEDVDTIGKACLFNSVNI